MTSHQNSYFLNREVNFNQFSPPLKRFLTIITHYETPKIVRFESKWIASLSLFVKLTLAISCICLMWQRDAYQVFDRSPISAVIIKIKMSSNCSKNSSIMQYFPQYNCTQSIYDVNDFILPAIENSAISIATRMTEVEHVLKYCDNTTIETQSTSLVKIGEHRCYDKARCILPPIIRDEYGNSTWIFQRPLCWFKLSKSIEKINYQALDYILFIKHFVEFPQLNLLRDNVASNSLGKSYIDDCEYDPNHHRLCPKFRISKILEMMKIDPNEYEQMFHYGSLLEIKINWKCNLDLSLNLCEPHYEFHRLDYKHYKDNPYELGSKFLTAKHFFRPNDSQLQRLHTTIYNLHIVVSVTGDVGRFDLFQTTTSIGSFVGIFGTGTIVCDLIAASFTNFKKVKYDT